MSPYWRRIIVNAIIKVSGTLLEVLLPVILAYIVDTIVPTRNSNSIIVWGVMMVIISIVAWVLNISANRMASRTVSLAIQNIRQDLFDRSMRLSSKQMDKISVSSLESRLTSDTYVIHRFLGATLRMGIRSVMLFLGGVFFCFFLSPKLASILLFLVLPLFLVIRYIFSKASPLFRTVQNRLDDMVQVIRENIRGIKVTKALDKTEYEKERYQQSNNSVREAELAAVDQMAIMSPAINSILYGGLTVVIIWGATLVDQGAIQVGVIMAFLSYFIQITNSLMMMNRMFNIYNRSSASTKRINEVLTMPLDDNQIVVNEVELPEASPNVPEVEFRNVSFSYLGKKTDIDNISFKIYKGQTLGIMGATGSGKSTIIRLLLRQYDVDEGEILIRGKGIKNLNNTQLNKLFGSVFQNDFLFRGSIRENIDFGRNLDDDRLLDAAQHAQAIEFISTKNGELDFDLASKGVNLSGGQKQRLLLTRAFAANPDILILDDSSSALDFRTDANLRKAIEDYYQETTSIIIAQRVSSILSADHIIFIHQGKILDQGTHQQLIETCDPYREIASMQLGNLYDNSVQEVLG